MFYDIIRRKIFVLDSLAAPVGNISRETLPYAHTRTPTHTHTHTRTHAHTRTDIQIFLPLLNNLSNIPPSEKCNLKRSINSVRPNYPTKNKITGCARKTQVSIKTEMFEPNGSPLHTNAILANCACVYCMLTLANNGRTVVPSWHPFVVSPGFIVRPRCRPRPPCGRPWNLNRVRSNRAMPKTTKEPNRACVKNIFGTEKN